MKDETPGGGDGKFKKGSKGGPGRPPGTPNKLTPMSEFFLNLTQGNLLWRECVSRILTGKAKPSDLRYASEFRAWSDIALDRALGTPAKAVIEKPQRDSLVFVSAPTRGLHMPWCWSLDTIRRKDEPGYRQDLPTTHEGECRADPPDAIKALEKANPPPGEVVIDVTAAKPDAATKPDEADGEGLELVRPLPPEDPSAYRDRS